MEQVLLYSNILLWTTMILVFFFLFLIFRQFGEVYLKSADAISRDGIELGNQVPKFKGNLFLQNNAITEKDIKGKPTIIVFISPTCKACKDLSRDWNESYEKYNNYLNFLIIANGEEEEFNKMFKKNKFEGSVVLDKYGELVSRLRVRVSPFAYILDEQSVVIGKGLCNGNEHIQHYINLLNNKNILDQERVV